MIYHTLRGGSFYSDAAWDLRATDRNRLRPEFRLWYVGFRLIIRREP